ncbi:MAG: MFS transporter [Ruminococcaceae bacterium]|nr:MFS transporter [Oscillospiraceae bacterium]
MRFRNTVLYLIMILYTAHVSAISTIVSELSSDPSIGVSGSGLIFTVNFIGYILFALPCGALSDKFGKKPILLSALAGMILFFPLFAVAEPFALRCVMMFFLGGCGGIVNCITASYIGDINPQNPDYYTNLLQSIACIGAILSPFLLSLLITVEIEWKYYYFILAAITLVLALLLLTFPKSQSGGGSGFSFRKAVTAFKGAAFPLICLCMFCYTGAEVAAWGWLSSLLQTEFGSNVLLSGLGVSLFWLGMAVGRYLCGLLLKKFTLRQLIIALSVLTTAVTLFAIFCKSTWLFLILAVAMGLTCSSIFPFLSSYGASQTHLGTGISFTLLMVCGNTGSATVPYAMGLLSDVTGMSASLILPLVLFAAVPVIILLLSRTKKTAQN